MDRQNLPREGRSDQDRFRTPSFNSAFLAGHVAAFEAFGGVPRSLLYDNLKSVVTARRGPAITYNPTFLAFSGHYAFEAPVTWPRRPQEKGRVERNIRYVRSAFMAGRDIDTPLDQLNADARCWVPEYSGLKRRVCPAFPADGFFSDSVTIRDGFSSPSRAFQVATLSA